MNDAPNERTPPVGSRYTLGLWAGLLLGPLAWLGHLNAGYAAATLDCGSSRAVIFAVTLSSAAMAGGGVWLAVRAGRGLRDDANADGGRAARRRFMSRGGIALGALFLLVILVQGLPALLLPPCR